MSVKSTPEKLLNVFFGGWLSQDNSIDDRCTKPFTPKTNGIIEKVNDIIIYTEDQEKI